jgi:hypothetical protein
MSSSNPSSDRPGVVNGDAISLTILTPSVHPGPQGEVTIHSSLEDRDHDIENASGSSSVRSRIQLIATLLALFVRAILKIL